MSPTPDDSTDRREALLDSWVETRRHIAQLEAEAAAMLAERARILEDDLREHGGPHVATERSVFAEYAAAGHVSKGSIECAFANAHFLDCDHPGVLDAFRRGTISAPHVRELIHAGFIVREAIDDGRVAPEALELYDIAAVIAAEHTTPAGTRAQAREIAAALVGETVVERHRRAASERSVTMRPVDDGLALLMVVLPEYLAAAIMDRLTHMSHEIIAARGEQQPGTDSDDTIFSEGDTFTTDPSSADSSAPTDTRSIDEVRADLVADLLLGAEPSSVHGTALENIRGAIQVTVAATTLTGADDRPGQLDGFGPLHPDIARNLAGFNGGWTRLFLDSTGMVIKTDTYSPTESMRRFLRARDEHCRFPGCRMPVHRCQIDHNHDHAKGGKTELGNLSHLCVSHHSIKHPDVDDHYRWRVEQHADGTLDWISPLGRHYEDTVSRRVMFV